MATAVDSKQKVAKINIEPKTTDSKKEVVKDLDEAEQFGIGERFINMEFFQILNGTKKPKPLIIQISILHSNFTYILGFGINYAPPVYYGSPYGYGYRHRGYQGPYNYGHRSYYRRPVYYY